MTDAGSSPAGPVVAAGGVLWRARPGGGTPAFPAVDEVEVALVHRPKYDDWSLPKGKLDPGEHVLTAAVREIEEETGVRAALGRPLGTSRYVKDGRDKEVHYWSARAVRGSSDGSFAPHDEVDELLWLPLDRASRRLTREADGAVLDAFAEAPPTIPVAVLRHAVALPRKGWPAGDRERPLAPEGEAQARAVAPLLAAYGIERIVSSPALRCTATVAPYADAVGLAPQLEECLTEEVAGRDPGGARAVLRRLLEEDRPALVCAHRKGLPALLAEAAADTAAGADPVPERMLRKGELLVLHVREGRVEAGEHHQAASLG